jgi:hypothetical protein
MSAEIPDLDRDLRALAEALELWSGRDDSKPQPGVRQSANTAVDCIDRMLAALHQVRAELVSGVRASDDASMARAAALLARLRAERTS